MLHGGDNDSTGTIAGAWYGAMYGYQGVPKCHMDNLEGYNRAVQFGNALFERSEFLKQ